MTTLLICRVCCPFSAIHNTQPISRIYFSIYYSVHTCSHTIVNTSSSDKSVLSFPVMSMPNAYIFLQEYDMILVCLCLCLCMNAGGA